jgi:hypothetical protein
VPVQREYIHTAGLTFVHPSGQTKDEDDGKHDQSSADVKRVQANQ